MKRFIALWIIPLLMLPAAASAQQRDFNDFYRKYSGREGYTSIEITAEMARMLGNAVTSRTDNTRLGELLGDIRSIRIVVSKWLHDDYRSDMERLTSGGAYRLMSVVTRDGQTTRFYYTGNQRSGDAEFLMLSTGAAENVVVNIFGAFDIKDISQLSTLKISGLNRIDYPETPAEGTSSGSSSGSSATINVSESATVEVFGSDVGDNPRVTKSRTSQLSIKDR